MTVALALIGSGFIGRVHASSIQAIADSGAADVRIVAVCDRDPERARALSAGTGAKAWTDDPGALIDDDALDAVIVGTPTVTHEELVVAAAQAGKAVFCEKPLAFDALAARRIADAVSASGVVGQCGLVLRFSPTYNAVVRELGRAEQPLVAVVMRDDQYFPVGGHYGSEWRVDHRTAGSGVLLEHSIHDADVFRWLGGDCRVVGAATRSFAGHPGIEDVAAATVEFDSGALANLTTVWHEVRTRGSLRHLEVFTADLMVSTSADMFGDVRVATSAGERIVAAQDALSALCDDLEIVGRLRDRIVTTDAGKHGLAGAAAYVLQALSFVRSVDAGLVATPGLEVACRAHDLVDAMYAAASNSAAAYAAASRSAASRPTGR